MRELIFSEGQSNLDNKPSLFACFGFPPVIPACPPLAGESRNLKMDSGYSPTSEFWNNIYQIFPMKCFLTGKDKIKVRIESDLDDTAVRIFVHTMIGP